MRIFFIIGLWTVISVGAVRAQLLGGSAEMNFLRLPAGATAMAKGGTQITTDIPDLSASFQNPALLESGQYPQLHSSFVILPGGTKGYFLSGSFSKPAASVATALSIQYFDHGNTIQTDAGGSTLGSFRPRDWSVQLAASMPYRNRWRGGVGLQLAHSTYGAYRAMAGLSNIGIQYRDTARGFQAAAIFRHAGFFIRRYDPGSNPQLPVELAFGVTQKWMGSPFSFGLVLQRMQRWTLDSDDLYDPAFSPTGIDNRRSTFVGQFFNHLIIQTQIQLHSRVQVLGGYNFLRRRELTWAGRANGLTGFSFGFRTTLDRIELAYGRAYYQAGQALNQLSMQFSIRPNSAGWRR